MDFGAEMMFGVVSVEEPDPVVELVVAAHTPGDRFVGITAIMPVITVQVREAMAEIPEADEKNDVVPVQDTQGDEGAKKENDLYDAPIRFPAVFSLYRLENGLGIIPEKAEKHVAKGMLGFTVIAVLVNRKPIDRLAFFVRPVGVSLVMLHVNAIVEGLAEADGDRFKKREEAIEQRRSEIGIMNEVVGDAIDVPRDAD